MPILEKVNSNISNSRGLLFEAHQLMDEEADKQQQERASFEEHAKKLKHVHFEKTIKLNVGGVLYKTSLTTLVKDPNSMLAVMFSGRFELQVDEDGSYFIDRDGELFR